jgi:hypothetical protein
MPQLPGQSMAHRRPVAAEERGPCDIETSIIWKLDALAETDMDADVERFLEESRRGCRDGCSGHAICPEATPWRSPKNFLLRCSAWDEATSRR